MFSLKVSATGHGGPNENLSFHYLFGLVFFFFLFNHISAFLALLIAKEGKKKKKKNENMNRNGSKMKLEKALLSIIIFQITFFGHSCQRSAWWFW